MFRNIIKLYPTNFQSEQPDCLELEVETTPYFGATNRIITPEELSHSILYPQVDPLIGQIVNRLLAKTRPNKAAWNKESDDEIVLPQYDQWNETVAKKYATMSKNYLKFKNRFLQASAAE